jgi:membrane associated rhomboid family serine protease
MTLDDAGDDWIEVRRPRTHGEASQFALVLVAAGIDCRMAPQRTGVGLLVPAFEAERARRELDAYVWENRLPIDPPPEPGRFDLGLVWSLGYVCALLFVAGAAGRHLFGLDWDAAGAANAGLIAGGEWWRAVTALFLHANLEHLAGNLAAGVLIGAVLAQVVGGGLAWLMILLAGALGNFVNALVQSAGHTSIGASTAVFGAVGLVAALAAGQRWAEWRTGLRRWAPVAAGAMILALFGTGGERTDVAAHVAGFVVGCLLGGGLVLIKRRRPEWPPPRQFVYAGVAAAMVVAAWLSAAIAAG